MRKSLGVQPRIYPEPVFIIAAYDEAGTPQCMNAAWGGFCASDKIMLSLNPAHKTVAALRAAGAFTVSMGQADQVIACDYVGITSGNNVADKFARAGFHATKSQLTGAPLIDELAYTLDCILVSYDEDSHILIGEIKDISVDERILDETGTINVADLAPLSFDPHTKKYYKVTEAVANARSVGKQLQ